VTLLNAEGQPNWAGPSLLFGCAAGSSENAAC